MFEVRSMQVRPVRRLIFLSARQYARAYTVYSGLVWSGLTVPKFLPLVPLFTVSAAGLDSVFPFKDYIL